MMGVRRDQWIERACRGGVASLLVLAACGLIVLVTLFNTVHDRTTDEILKGSPPRYRELITYWRDRGYLRNAGMWVRHADEGWSPPAAGEDPRFAYRSSMAHLTAAHVIQRVSFIVRGHYSDRLMVIHNQAVIWLSATLLGWLAMRLALHLLTPPGKALLLGLIVLVLYQTFPSNLVHYWELYASGVVQVFAILFLLATHALISGGHARRWGWIRAVAVFGLAWTDPSITLTFVPMVLLVTAVTGFPAVRGQRIVTTVVLPALLAFGLWGLQVMWMKWQFPGLQFVGSGFFFRTGLDGSVEYVKGHWDLVAFTRFRYNLGLKWVALAVFGALSLVIPLWQHHRLPALRVPVTMLIASACLYLPYAFIFSQGVVIHPTMFDTYAVIPLLLSLFCLAPATLEQRTGQRGIFVAIAVIAAACYVMVQLRTYAIDHPFPVGTP